MKRIYPNDCVPAMYYDSLVGFDTEEELIYLGKENLTHLATFWKKRIGKFSKMSEEEKDPDKKDSIKEELRECNSKVSYLKSLIVRSESKPTFFTKPVISIGNRVVCFATDPDRYIVGTVVKIDRDEDTGIGSFIIRAFDKNLDIKSYDLKYKPNGFSMFLANDFDYYRAHPDYFRLVLNYLARPSNPAETDYVNRLINALNQSTISDLSNIT